MKIHIALVLTCLAVICSSVPQRFRSRQGRDKFPAGGYNAPNEEEYAAPLEEGYLAAQDEADNSYLAPEESQSDNIYLAPPEEDLGSYNEEDIGSYNDLDAAGSEQSDQSADPLKMLMNAVPGIPGEDYPIYSEVPETDFSCDTAIDGGYYADDSAECQAFHICTADGAGGLSQYSFLCPNGTIFNQNYFICDWWFNVDCSEAAAIAEAKNSELAAAREDASVVSDQAGAASDASGSYVSPAQESDTGYLAPASDAAGSYVAPVQESDAGYLAPESDASGSYVAPAQESDAGYLAPEDDYQYEYEEDQARYEGQSSYNK